MPSQRNDADHQVNKAADGGRNPADEAARAVTDEAARAGEQTAHAGADVLHRSSETARDDVQQQGIADVRVNEQRARPDEDQGG